MLQNKDKTQTYSLSRKAPFTCADCEHTSDSPIGIRTHWLRTHGPRAEQWKTNIRNSNTVPKKFRKTDKAPRGTNVPPADAEKVLLFSLTAESPYKCNAPGCDFESTSWQYLRIHQRKEHGMTAKAPFPTPAKRVYQRRTLVTAQSPTNGAVTALDQINHSSAQINFCYNCGHNLTSIAEPKFCSECGNPLAALYAALSVIAGH